MQLPLIPSLRPFLALALISCLLLPLPVNAEESVSTEEWDITADRITRYDEPASIVAEGNIVLVKRRKVPPQQPAAEEAGTNWSLLLEEEPAAPEITPADLDETAAEVYRTEVTIKADWVAYDIALNTIKARGNVSVVTDEDQLYAEQATVNLENETGVFKKATIQRKEHDLHLEGEVIEKTGFKTYHIENGWVVTCKVEAGETAPWSFAASDAVIEQDGYAVLKHARFRIKDIPLLYTPWAIVPAKNKRQTGLLLPELSTSEWGGFGINLPFFWNISDSTDLTLYTEYIANRGYMPGLEFRYVKSDSDKGVVMANYLNDDLSDPSETEYYRETGYTHDNQDRYWFRAKADQEFGDGWTTRLDLDIVSDRDYLNEFNAGLTGFDDSNDYFLDAFGRSLENKTEDQRANTLKLLKSWGTSNLNAELLAVNDVRANKSGNSPLWKLPQVDYDGAIPLGGFGDVTIEWDTSYVNYWREEGIGGHRVDLYPRFSAPVPLSPYLESRAEVGLRDTFYVVETYGDSTWDNDDTQNRFLYDLHAEVGTTLMRTFGLDSQDYTGLSHQVRPYVEYDFIPEEDQDELPYFSGIDRIGQQNRLNYGIDNFFDLLTTDDQTKEYGYFKVEQAYSLLDEDSDEPFSDITARLGWRPIDGSEITYKTAFDVYGDGFVRHNLEGNYTNSRGDQFKLEYIWDNDGETEQVNALVRAALAAQWLVDFKIEHSLSEEETNEAHFSLIYRALCWSMEMVAAYTPEDTRYMVMFNLANIGTPFRLSY